MNSFTSRTPGLAKSVWKWNLYFLSTAAKPAAAPAKKTPAKKEESSSEEESSSDEKEEEVKKPVEKKGWFQLFCIVNFFTFLANCN